MQIPSTTVEFLDLLKARKGLTSDYQLFKSMGWAQTTVSKYRVGGRVMSPSHALQVADELGLPRAYLLACMEAERERDDQVAGVWQDLARRLKHAAAIILIVLGLLLPGPKAEAAQAVAAVPVNLTSATGIYIMRSCLGRLLERLRAWWLRTEYPALQFA